MKNKSHGRSAQNKLKIMNQYNICAITYIQLMTVSRIYINYYELLVICGNWIVITWIIQIKFSHVFLYIYIYIFI